MKMIGTHFTHLRISLIVAVLVITIAIPGQSTTAQGTVIQDDDFPGTSLDTIIWTVTHTEPGSSISVANSELRINVPSGDSYTFSSTNIKAPRVLQAISDADFAVEVKFTSSMSVYQDDKIQGILVYDQGANQWLRFDFNTDSNSLNTYIGYLDSSSMLHHIENVSDISTSQSAFPLYMQVQYTKSSNQWMMSYRIGDTGAFTMKKTFNESSFLGSSGSFTPTHIGLFAGSTGDDQPGHLMTADYFMNVAPAEPPPPMDERVYLPIIIR